MKVAILILAHQELDQLELLVENLCTDFEIFIHLDKKWAVSPKHFNAYERVHAIKHHEVSWGSYNQIRATYDLLKLAHQHACDYYLLISGQDFPIKSNEEIKKQLKEIGHLNFIQYYALPRLGWGPEGGMERMRFFWPEYSSGLLGKLGQRFGPALRNFQLRKGHRRKIQPLIYYGGGNWFNLTHDTVTYILDFVMAYPGYLTQFRFTKFCHEIWIQTIIMNSPYRKITHNEWLRYIDWENGPEYPRIMRIDDYDKIITSNGLFARKFDRGIDGNILKLVNEFRLRKREPSVTAESQG